MTVSPFAEFQALGNVECYQTELRDTEKATQVTVCTLHAVAIFSIGNSRHAGMPLRGGVLSFLLISPPLGRSVGRWWRHSRKMGRVGSLTTCYGVRMSHKSCPLSLTITEETVFDAPKAGRCPKMDTVRSGCQDRKVGESVIRRGE